MRAPLRRINCRMGKRAQDQSLTVSHLIMEAARRVDEWERLRKHVPSFKAIYCLDETGRKAIESGELEVEPPERFIAGLLDGSRDVEDLLATLPSLQIRGAHDPGRFY